MPNVVELNQEIVFTGSCLNASENNPSAHTARWEIPVGIEIDEWSASRIVLSATYDRVFAGGVNLLLCPTQQVCYETPVYVPNYVLPPEGVELTAGVITVEIGRNADADAVAERNGGSVIQKLFSDDDGPTLSYLVAVPVGEERAKVREFANDYEVSWAFANMEGRGVD